MRRWLMEAGAAARFVSERSALWLIGALAWAVTLGPVPLLVAVVPTPSVADLTFLGARVVSSGAWPWNLVAVGVAVLCAVLVAVALAAMAESALLGGPARRLMVISLVAMAPASAALVASGLALAVVVPTEFILPDGADGGPLLRTVLLIAPLLALFALTVMAGSAYAAAAARLVARAGMDLPAALMTAPAALFRSGVAGWTHAVASFALRIAYVVFAAMLLSVLWAPIGQQLAVGAGFDVARGLLLVGFVAIWLCLVLGGGALHAWGSMSWSRIIVIPPSRAEAGPPHQEIAPTP